MSVVSSTVDRINSFARKVPTWLVYLLLIIPIPYLFYVASTGGMGVEPINPLEREMGELTLKLIIVGLMITPLFRFARLNFVKFRRAIGVMSFVYVVVHLGIWVVLDMSLRWGQMWEDIWKRPYITIGMVAFVLMIPLAVTSNNLSLRKLGPIVWRKMHKLVYLIAVLGAVHFVMVKKVWEAEPVVYLGIILVLVAIRYIPKRKKVSASASS